MTTALYVLAALLTALQLFDGWCTYQVLKRGGSEKNPVMAEIMDTFGTYPGLLLVKCGAAGLAWYLALMEGNPETKAAILVVLMMAYVWVSVSNWQALQKQKGK